MGKVNKRRPTRTKLTKNDDERHFYSLYFSARYDPPRAGTTRVVFFVEMSRWSITMIAVWKITHNNYFSTRS